MWEPSAYRDCTGCSGRLYGLRRQNPDFGGYRAALGDEFASLGGEFAWFLGWIRVFPHRHFARFFRNIVHKILIF